MINWSNNKNLKTVTVFEGEIYIFIADCSKL